MFGDGEGRRARQVGRRGGGGWGIGGGGREGRQYPPPVLVLLVLPASGGASRGLLRESGGSRSMGTPVWVPFCWMGAAAIMFAAAAAAGRIAGFSLHRGEVGGWEGGAGREGKEGRKGARPAPLLALLRNPGLV